MRDAADMSDMVIGFGFEWTASIRDVSTCHNSIEFGIIDVTAEVSSDRVMVGEAPTGFCQMQVT